MLKATITRLKEHIGHEESMPFLLESVGELIPFAPHRGTPLWIALLTHLTNTLCLIHRKLVAIPAMVLLKLVELVAIMGKVAPTKVQDSEARLTKVQEEARVDSNFTIISQWWKTHGKH